jgi:hypothetical protein
MPIGFIVCYRDQDHGIYYSVTDTTAVRLKMYMNETRAMDLLCKRDGDNVFTVYSKLGPVNAYDNTKV